MKSGNWHRRDYTPEEVHVRAHWYRRTSGENVTLQLRRARGDDTDYLELRLTPEEARALAADLAGLANGIDPDPSCPHDWTQTVGGVQCAICHTSRPGSP